MEIAKPALNITVKLVQKQPAAKPTRVNKKGCNISYSSAYTCKNFVCTGFS